MIEEFTLPKEPRDNAPTSVIATVFGLEENLRSILNLGDSMRNMPSGTEPVMNGSAYQLAEIRGRMFTSQIRQLQTADVRLPDKTLDAIRKAWQVLLFLKPDRHSRHDAMRKANGFDCRPLTADSEACSFIKKVDAVAPASTR